MNSKILSCTKKEPSVFLANYGIIMWYPDVN